MSLSDYSKRAKKAMTRAALDGENHLRREIEAFGCPGVEVDISLSDTDEGLMYEVMIDQDGELMFATSVKSLNDISVYEIIDCFPVTIRPCLRRV